MVASWLQRKSARSRISSSWSNTKWFNATLLVSSLVIPTPSYQHCPSPPKPQPQPTHSSTPPPPLPPPRGKFKDQEDYQLSPTLNDSITPSRQQAVSTALNHANSDDWITGLQYHFPLIFSPANTQSNSPLPPSTMTWINNSRLHSDQMKLGIFHYIYHNIWPWSV